VAAPEDNAFIQMQESILKQSTEISGLTCFVVPTSKI